MRAFTASALLLVSLACGDRHDSSRERPLPAWMEHRASDVAAALQGDVDAMHRLCFDLTYGDRGVPQDGIQARVWCAAAAERGHASAQTLYAQLLAAGHGGPRDQAAAARWYGAAAMQGHEHAIYVLGLMYRNGEGVPHDSAKADSLLDVARALGYDSVAVAEQARGQSPRAERSNAR